MSIQEPGSPENAVQTQFGKKDNSKTLKKELANLSIGSLTELHEIYKEQAKPDQKRSDQLDAKIQEISRLKEQEEILKLIPRIVMDMTYKRKPNKKMVFTKSQLKELTPRMISDALKSKEGTKEFLDHEKETFPFTKDEIAPFVDSPNPYDDSPRDTAANYLEKYLKEKLQGSPITNEEELEAHLSEFLEDLDNQLEEAQEEKELYDDPDTREYRENVIRLVKKHKDKIEKERIPYLDKETGHPVGLSDSTPEKIFEWIMEIDPTRHREAVESAVKELVGRFDQLENAKKIVDKYYGNRAPDKIKEEVRRYEIREDLRKNPRPVELYRDERTRCIKIRFEEEEEKYPAGFPYEAFGWEYPFLTYAYVSKPPTKSRSHKPDTDYYMLLKLPGEKGSKRQGSYIRLTKEESQKYQKRQKVIVRVVAHPQEHKNIGSFTGVKTRVKPSQLEIQPKVYREGQNIPDSSRGEIPAKIFGLEEADEKFKKD